MNDFFMGVVDTLRILLPMFTLIALGAVAYCSVCLVEKWFKRRYSEDVNMREATK